MDDRRSFLARGLGLGFGAGAGAALGSGAATAAATGTPASPSCTSVYAGLVGRGYARGPHGLVHFQDAGGRVPVRAGERALVLLHQSPSSSRQFEAAFEPLIARGIRFVAIDTPGFGFSDPTPSIPTVEEWTPSVAAVLDHLGLDQVDVLGHHTGSLIATELALQHPRRVRRLVLNGPFPLTADERAARLERSKVTRVKDQPRLDGSHLLETFKTRLRMYGTDPDLDAVTRGVALKYQALGPHWWGHHAAYLYDHARSLGRLTQPTLVFTNTGDDIYDLAQRARTIRPDFDYLELQGGTHDIVDQRPRAWSEAVVGFLRRPERPASA